MALIHSALDEKPLLSSEDDVELIKDWLFIRSNAPVQYIVAYLFFVLIIGPKFMKNRNAFKLKHVLLVHNAIQVVVSVYLCYKGITAYFSKYYYNLKDDEELITYKIRVSDFCWTYVLAKISELLDTVFFVLRKKYNQVTFLHVYHHSFMVFISWYSVNHWPATEANLVCGILNSMVHVVMYFYYLLSAMGPEYQKYVWWKKYMTMIQLVQFCTMISFLTYMIAYTDVNAKAATIFSFSAFIFFILFLDFYRKSYAKKNTVQSVNVNIKTC